MSPDIINGLFELSGGLLIANNCRTLWKDQMVRGVNVSTTAFFTAWGVWNLYYYPHLGQWWSFVGGICIASANTIWIALAIRYRSN